MPFSTMRYDEAVIDEFKGGVQSFSFRVKDSNDLMKFHSFN